MHENILKTQLNHEQYDIIIAGAGLSGLSLACALIRRPTFQQKKILLIDRDHKRQNDRTWCFWATDQEALPPVICKSWDYLRFYAPGFEKKLDIQPLRYHMVRGIDFYSWAFQQLDRSPNVKRLHAAISSIDAANGIVHTDAGDFVADFVLNSAFTQSAILPRPSTAYPQSPFSVGVSNAVPDDYGPFVRLFQHFKGWMVEAEPGAFDPNMMTFMDFRIEQAGETRFVYVLPLTDRQALVEFTVFSQALLPAPAYDEALRNYISRFLKIEQYKVLEDEFGVIPMTNFPFPSRQEGRLINIGTAGGFVKASSGYAFKRTQQKIERFAAAWEQSGRPDPALLKSPIPYRAFDNIFLQVLKNRNELGREIFTSLFKKLPPKVVLRFLDEDATFAQTLRLLSAPPAWPFLHAFAQQFSLLIRLR